MYCVAADRRCGGSSNAARMPNLSLLPAEFVGDSHAGLDSVGAMSWYMTLVVNPQEFERSCPIVGAFSGASTPDSWGVMSGSQSPIFEIAAKLFFGGNAALMHEDGITAVIGKIAEIKHNVKLWWQDEGSMQTALTNEDVLGGTYMHDTAMVMSRNGSPVRSLFPKEGAVSSTNYWCQPSASVHQAEAEEFINFCCSPQAQELIARHVGSAPLLPRSKLRLTDQEFAAVSSLDSLDPDSLAGALQIFRSHGTAIHAHGDQLNRNPGRRASAQRGAARAGYGTAANASAAHDIRVAAQGLCKSYGTQTIVDQVSLTVPEGRFVCFLGPSGCGKTTLLRMIAGLEQPTSGRILLNGPGHHRNPGAAAQLCDGVPGIGVVFLPDRRGEHRLQSARARHRAPGPPDTGARAPRAHQVAGCGTAAHRPALGGAAATRGHRTGSGAGTPAVPAR